MHLPIIPILPRTTIQLNTTTESTETPSPGKFMTPRRITLLVLIIITSIILIFSIVRLVRVLRADYKNFKLQAENLEMEAAAAIKSENLQRSDAAEVHALKPRTEREYVEWRRERDDVEMQASRVERARAEAAKSEWGNGVEGGGG